MTSSLPEATKKHPLITRLKYGTATTGRYPEATKKFKTAAIGVQKILEQNRLARKHKKKLSAFFKEQKTLALNGFAKLRHYFVEEKSPAKLSKATPIPSILDGWDGTWGDISDISYDDLQKIVKLAESEGMQAGIDQLKNLFQMSGVDPVAGSTFDLSNPRAVAWFKKFGGSVDYIKGIQKATSDQVKTIIQQAIDEGWSYNETAKAISDQFDEFSRDRANLIAVTEIGNSYEEGNRSFADSLAEAGIHIVKSWQTSKDDKVSDGCQENEDAGWIELDEPFPSGDQQPLRFPGCRCYAIYEQASTE